MSLEVTGPPYLAPGQPVDLTNCEREPIHIPGSIQPRGVLLALHEPELRVVQVSENLTEMIGPPVGAALGRPVAEVLGQAVADQLASHLASFSDLRERNPLLVQVPTAAGVQQMDAVLHRPPQPPGAGLLVVELEPSVGPRPFAFPNTYQAVRAAVGQLNRAVDLQQLYDIAARATRDLTGFDRVMIYRFDDEYNGVVVAEARRPDLNTFLGLHYPASDIPAQARALYEKNWVRLISDVRYRPRPVRPAVNPLTGAALDLTHSTLRSVSPIHLEYLQNMGVAASMSISLIREDRLWGLVACHHYSGPHDPPFGVRAAAEFLGSALSLRLVDRAEQEERQAAMQAQGVLADLAARSRDDQVELETALLTSPGLLDLVPADGVLVRAEGQVATRGLVPDPATARALLAWAAAGQEDVVAVDCLRDTVTDPTSLQRAGAPAGMLAITLPDGQAVVWFRQESVHTVEWGGDPQNKAIARQEGADVRISPRLSFERWRQTVRGRSRPWTGPQQSIAATLRTHLVESLYARGRAQVRDAEWLQRSLLPGELPSPPGWRLDGRYLPSANGRVGGDWYDAFQLRDGRLAVVVGDVAGHGLKAAATMAQLRYALRGYLLDSADGERSVHALDRLVDWLLPDELATVVVVLTDLATGGLQLVNAGHLPPLVRMADGQVRRLDGAGTPPLGLDVTPRTAVDRLAPGEQLVLYSDGLVERRGENLSTGLDRLSRALADGGAAVDQLVRTVGDPHSGDDVTVLVLSREAGPGSTQPTAR